MSYICKKCSALISGLVYHNCKNYKGYGITKDDNFNNIEYKLKKFDETDEAKKQDME